MTAETAMNLKVGDIVILYSFRPGQLAIIYDTYKDYENPMMNGVSLITEQGEELGGFSFEEQKLFLEYSRSTSFVYEFTSVVRLNFDFKTKIKQYFL